MKITLKQLNQMNKEDFIDTIGTVFEHSPWIAEKTWYDRPFSSVTELHEVMIDIVKGANMKEKMDLLKAHPELGTRQKMTEESVEEQKGAGLDQLSDNERQTMYKLNEAYKESFGFPFIMAVRGQNNHRIKTALQERLNNSYAKELEIALHEIYKISRFRLEDLVKDIGSNDDYVSL